MKIYHNVMTFGDMLVLYIHFLLLFNFQKNVLSRRWWGKISRWWRGLEIVIKIIWECDILVLVWPMFHCSKYLVGFAQKGPKKPKKCQKKQKSPKSGTYTSQINSKTIRKWPGILVRVSQDIILRILPDQNGKKMFFVGGSVNRSPSWVPGPEHPPNAPRSNILTRPT